ncbi:unnamed protein product, partial [Meganyctiphanes norvegica]
DTRSQRLKTNTEVIMKWHDDALEWNPANYTGVEAIRVPWMDIWAPDIILKNVAAGGYQDAIINTNAIIFYTGEVELLSHSIFTSLCNLDLQWYPFDQQYCALVFHSWTYDHTQIQMTAGPADLSRFAENPEYFLEDFFHIKRKVKSPCCPEPFSSITYEIQIQRRTVFSLFFFILPGILINICAILVFSLPAETNEKIMLGISSMLAMMVFIMAMTERLTPVEKLPLAGLYYGVCIVMITLNITCSVFILNLNWTGHRGYEVAPWLRKSIWKLSKWIRMRVPHVVRESWKLDPEDDFEDYDEGSDMDYDDKDENNLRGPQMNNVFNTKMNLHMYATPLE